MSDAVRSSVFRVDRARLAWIAAEEYVRQFWWFAGAIPLFGILALIFGGSDLLRGLGLFALLWPLTIPARAVLATGRVGKALAKGVSVIVDQGALYFEGASGDGFRVAPESIRQTVLRKGTYIIRLRAMGFIPVPASAFPDGPSRASFERAARLS